MNMRYILTSLLFFSFTNSLFSMKVEKKVSYLEEQGYPATKPEVLDAIDKLNELIPDPEDLDSKEQKEDSSRWYSIEEVREQALNSNNLDFQSKVIQYFSYNRKNISIGTGVTFVLGAAGYWLYSKFYKTRTPLKKVETDQVSQSAENDIFNFIVENQEHEPKTPNNIEHKFGNLGFEQLFDKLIATLSNDQWHMYDDMDDKLIRIHDNPLILRDKDFEHFLCALNEEQEAIVELMIEKFTLEKK